MSFQLVTAPQVTVATSGTEQRIVAANVQNVVAVFVGAPAANTGNAFLGDASVSTTRGIEIAKGTTYRMDAPQGGYLDIYNMWVDVASSGDKVNVAYLVKV